MNTSDRFLRFAAECEVMAKFSRTPENRAVWNGLAERWALPAFAELLCVSSQSVRATAERRASDTGLKSPHSAPKT